MTQIIYAEEAELEALIASQDDDEPFHPFYSGDEFGLNFGYYASDDELVEDDPLDAAAYAYWLQQQVDD